MNSQTDAAPKPRAAGDSPVQVTVGDGRDTAPANPERALTGEHGVVSSPDAADRRRIGEASRETDERYRALYENMLEGFAYCRMSYDEEGHPDDWAYLAVNPAFERLTGLTDVIGRRITEIIPTIKAEAPELFDVYGNVVQTGASAEFEIDFTPLGRWLRISVLRPAPDHFVAMFTDVTERKQAEAALIESEDRFKYVFEHSVVGKSLTRPNGQIQVNGALCEMLGYTQEELAHHTWRDVTHPDDVAETERQMAQLLSGAADAARYMKRYLKKDGSVVWADVSSSLRRDENGTPLYFVTTVIDITERHQIERLLAVPSAILRIMAAPTPLRETAESIVTSLRRVTGFDAVGLRLQEGDDYPFIGAVGYSDEFLEAENTLALHYSDGGVCRNEDGSVSLECTCGLVLSGQTDPSNPLFTAAGSAWTNDSHPLLGLPAEDDPRLHPRNRCIHVGFQSIALIPLRADGHILGLLHLADRRRDRFTSGMIDFFEGLGASIGVALQSKRALQALSESEALYRSILSSAPDGIAITDLVGTLRMVSPAAVTMFGLGREEEMLGGSLIAFLVPVESERTQGCETLYGPGSEGSDEVRVPRADGSTFDLEVKGEFIRDTCGLPSGIVFILRDVTEGRRRQDDMARLNDELSVQAVALAEANATITRIAKTDVLTDLANRRHFYEALETSVSFARRHPSPLAVISLDLDGLKRVNDTAGHEAGDAVLASFAALLAALCRAEDLPARLGGDEFSVSLPGIELDGAEGLAERVLAAVRASADLAERGVTASAGVAAWKLDELPHDLLRRADEALYAAKRGGGDAVAARD